MKRHSHPKTRRRFKLSAGLKRFERFKPKILTPRWQIYYEQIAREKSPYLKHAAHQKIDWHPWSEEAFERARRENKPVFLSSW
jgi:hypothetical protein